MAFGKLKQFGSQMADLKRMRDQAAQLQRQLAAEEVVVEEQGVKVVISGDQKIRELRTEDVSDQVLLEALNKAIKKSQEVAAKKLQEMSGGLAGLSGMLGK